MARKTIEVGRVLRFANNLLAAPGSTADERESVCAVIETVLMETDNYRGFAYLPKEQYPNEVVGIGTRRRYFVSSTIDADYLLPILTSQKSKNNC
jgi:hypothetical protein